MENTTKEKILDAALVSFAENGYKGTNLRDLATKYLLTGTKDIYTKVFEEMMDKGILKKDDLAMLAFAYTTPITSMVHLCDREPEREREITYEIKGCLLELHRRNRYTY